MALVLDDDQILLRDTAIEFARERLPVATLRRLRDTHDATGFDLPLWRQMGELGWTGMLIPADLGGTEFGYLGLGLVIEALGRTLAATPMLSTVALSGSAIALSGDDERTRELLTQIAAAQTVIALALEESASHSPSSIATQARHDGGDHYVLSGRKCFVIDGHAADQLIVVARDGNSEGLSMLLVDPQLPGVKRERLTMVDSRNSAHISFDNVRVDSHALLGAEGDAGRILEAVLDRGRILLAAEMLGMAQEAFDVTLAYLKQRTQFGVPIGSFQALKHRAVHMFAEIELARSVVLEALSALDEKRPDVPHLASLCKARLNDTLMLISNEAVQMHGGMGVTDEIDIGLYLKRARVAQATLGSSAFHRDRFAACENF